MSNLQPDSRLIEIMMKNLTEATQEPQVQEETQAQADTPFVASMEQIQSVNNIVNYILQKAGSKEAAEFAKRTIDKKVKELPETEAGFLQLLEYLEEILATGNIKSSIDVGEDMFVRISEIAEKYEAITEQKDGGQILFYYPAHVTHEEATNRTQLISEEVKVLLAETGDTATEVTTTVVDEDPQRDTPFSGFDNVIATVTADGEPVEIEDDGFITLTGLDELPNVRGLSEIPDVFFKAHGVEAVDVTPDITEIPDEDFHNDRDFHDDDDDEGAYVGGSFDTLMPVKVNGSILLEGVDQSKIQDRFVTIVSINSNMGDLYVGDVVAMAEDVDAKTLHDFGIAVVSDVKLITFSEAMSNYATKHYTYIPGSDVDYDYFCELAELAGIEDEISDGKDPEVYVTTFIRLA